LTARWHLIRGRLRRNAGRHRLVALAATLLPGLLLLTGLDWLAALPPAARALGLGGLLAAALIRPFLQAGAADDAELIGRLEARWPRLRDRLRTALTTDRPPAGGLWDALRERAADDLARLPADPLAPPRPAAAWLAGAAAAGLGLWAGVEPASLGQALARLAMPFQGRPWTVVADDSPAFTLAGKPYPLRARLTGRLPGRVRIRFADREGVGERIVPVAAGDDGSATVAVPLPVQGPFTYRLTARDAVVERRVGLATAPGLLAGAPAITLRPPPYTGLPPRTTAAGLGLEALRGTVLEVTGRADRPVAAAWIEVQPPPGGAPFRLAADPPAGDAFRIRAATAAWAAGVYQADLHWADRAGLEGTLRGAWRLEEDPPPAVTLERADPTAPWTCAAPPRIRWGWIRWC
jgi:hypothetical protein